MKNKISKYIINILVVLNILGVFSVIHQMYYNTSIRAYYTIERCDRGIDMCNSSISYYEHLLYEDDMENKDAEKAQRLYNRMKKCKEDKKDYLEQKNKAEQQISKYHLKKLTSNNFFICDYIPMIDVAIVSIFFILVLIKKIKER